MCMANNTELEFLGEIIEVLPAWKYKVRLIDMDIVVNANMSGRMKKNRITVMAWDYVKVELSEYEMSQWRIVYRYKDPQQAIALQNEQESSEQAT